MPVKPLVQKRSTDYDRLVDELFAEWTTPNPKASEPVILEEKGRNGKLVHLYVVWSKWAHTDRVERSEIIMDAAQKKLRPGDLLEITIAMGLTPDEAKQMGLEF